MRSSRRSVDGEPELLHRDHLLLAPEESPSSPPPRYRTRRVRRRRRRQWPRGASRREPPLRRVVSAPQADVPVTAYPLRRDPIVPPKRSCVNGCRRPAPSLGQSPAGGPTESAVRTDSRATRSRCSPRTQAADSARPSARMSPPTPWTRSDCPLWLTFRTTARFAAERYEWT